MTGKRTRYSAEFKARVALEALRGELTTAKLAAKHGIHLTMVGEGKRQTMEGLTAAFSGKSAAQESAKAAKDPKRIKCCNSKLRNDLNHPRQVAVLAPGQSIRDLMRIENLKQLFRLGP